MVSQHICSALHSVTTWEKKDLKTPRIIIQSHGGLAGISDLNHNPPTYTPMWWDAVLSLALHPPDFTYLANPFLTSSGVTKVFILSILSMC
jgi:hypothetical protein